MDGSWLHDCQPHDEPFALRLLKAAEDGKCTGIIGMGTRPLLPLGEGLGCANAGIVWRF